MFHKTIIAGNISWIGDMRETQSGKSVVDFQVAVDTSYKDKDGNKIDQAEFYTVTVWNGQAENFVKYKTVGDPVLVEGRMKFDRIENDDGKLIGYWPKLTFPNVTYLASRRGGNGNNGNQHDPQTAQAEPVATEEMDDIPF